LEAKRRKVANGLSSRNTNCCALIVLSPSWINIILD
jgi:hypothetical protein